MSISWQSSEFPLNPVWDGKDVDGEEMLQLLSSSIYELKYALEKQDKFLHAINDGIMSALEGIDENFSALKSCIVRLSEDRVSDNHKLPVHDDYGNVVGEMRYDEYLWPVKGQDK